jgi:hypothetical protein
VFSFLKRKKAGSEVVRLPDTPLSALYSHEFHRQIRVYRPQLIERRRLEEDASMLAVFDDSQVLAMHQVSWLWALNQATDKFKGRNAHRNRGALRENLESETFEWIQLAHAAQVTGRSQLRLWNKMCESRDEDRRTPLRRLASQTQKSGIDNPPLLCLVGERGELPVLDQ